MLVGHPPFGDADDAMGVYRQILHRKVAYPRRMARAPRELIERLLVAAPARRLGVLKDQGGAEDNILAHAFFRPVPSLDALERRVNELSG